MNTAATASYIGKCPECRAAVTAAWTVAEANEAGYQARSACCSRWTVMAKMNATVGVRECGDYCTDGTGKSCKCSCGGANHGLAWRIK